MSALSQVTAFDIEAVSGICGSISIACWIVVYSPQMIENFRRSSADGLSIIFLIVWSLGDLLNVIAALLQGVLPTMIILALYYVLADSVLVGQAFYYRGFTFTDKIKKREEQDEEDSDDADIDEEEDEEPYEGQPLLSRDHSKRDRDFGTQRHQRSPRKPHSQPSHRRSNLDGTHMSPALPLSATSKSGEETSVKSLMPAAAFRTLLYYILSILIVCGVGVCGWWIGQRSQGSGQAGEKPPSYPEYNVLGQVFGYLCALLYLGSRVPQLLLNFRRKSTEGISSFFFLFACLGNLTFIISIFAYSPACQISEFCQPGETASIYGRYISVNASWILGSAGTLVLDTIIFWQFYHYGKDEMLDQEADGGVMAGDSRGGSSGPT